MTLLQLQYFISLAKTLHYTRTSEQLHISQPSLSYEIRELERSLGVELFHRTRRQITLTEQGRAFLPYAEKAISTLDKGTELLQRMEKLSLGEIRLGYFHSVATPFVPDLVDGFYEAFGKETRFRFTEGNSREICGLLQKGELDLCFTPRPVEGCDSAVVTTQPLYCCVNENHPLASAASVEFSEIAAEPQLLLERGNQLREILDRCFAECGEVPNIVFELKECNAALQYVAMDFGIAVLPAVPALETGKVRAIPVLLNGIQLRRPVYLTCRDVSGLPQSAVRFRSYVLSNAD